MQKPADHFVRALKKFGNKRVKLEPRQEGRGYILEVSLVKDPKVKVAFGFGPDAREKTQYSLTGSHESLMTFRDLIDALSKDLGLDFSQIATAALDKLETYQLDPVGIELIEETEGRAIIEMYLRADPTKRVRYIATSSEDNTTEVSVQCEEEDWVVMEPYERAFRSQITRELNKPIQHRRFDSK